MIGEGQRTQERSKEKTLNDCSKIKTGITKDSNIGIIKVKILSYLKFTTTQRYLKQIL